MTLALAARPLRVSLRRLATPQVGRRVLVWGTTAVVAVLGLWTAVSVWFGGGDLLLLMIAASVPMSCAAVLLAGQRPDLAGVVVTAPFLWLLIGERWPGCWLVAQLAVISLAAARSWRATAVPVLGGLLALVLVASKETVILTGLIASDQGRFAFSGQPELGVAAALAARRRRVLADDSGCAGSDRHDSADAGHAWDRLEPGRGGAVGAGQAGG